jgi:hypothetical protein
VSNNPAIDRIISRQKPKVPSRGDVVEELVSQDIKTSLSQNVDITEPIESLEKSQTQPEPLETVRNTVRIEYEVDEALRRLCHSERITKETWLEAAFLVLQENPEQLEKVVALAQERLQRRKAIANYQRAKTMQKRFLKS